MQQPPQGAPGPWTNSSKTTENGHFATFSGKKDEVFRKTPIAGNAPREECTGKLPYEGQYQDLPAAFPCNNLPVFLQRILDCGLGKAQQDMLFCGVMATLGATVSWVRKQVMPFHKEKIARYGAALEGYQKKMQAWISEGKKREERTTTPQERFLGELPMSFTRQQSLAIGEKFDFTAQQVEYFTCKMMDKGELERKGRGEYSFIGDKRNVLGEENQESSGK